MVEFHQYESIRVVEIVSIICLTVLESVALLQGIDGAYFGLVIAIIAGIGGYEIAKKKVVYVNAER